MTLARTVLSGCLALEVHWAPWEREVRMGPRAQLVRPVHLAQKEQKERLQEQTALPGRLEQKEPRARLGPLARRGRRA